jgi:hypothetical protein
LAVGFKHGFTIPHEAIHMSIGRSARFKKLAKLAHAR